MTKCFLTGKTYPDYAPKHDNTAITAAIYNVFSHIDFVNREQSDLAMQCCHLILNLMNDNPDAFKEKLSAINKTIETDSDRIEDASERADLFMRGIFYAEVMQDGEPVYVTEENGDIRYSDWAQDIFNDQYDYHMNGGEGFEPDDVCRNGKPIADCECC